MLFNWLKTLFASIFKVSNTSPIDHKQTTTLAAPSLDSGQPVFKDNMNLTSYSTAIPFYPKLIDHLEMDHKHLIDLYINIGDTFSLKEFQLIPVQLVKFKEDLKAHLDTENIKFYGYLEQNLKDQTQQFTELRRFRKEMRSIERTVIKFLDHWIEFGVNRQSAKSFKAEYDVIGAALIKRIESEEKELYTMYVA